VFFWSTLGSIAGSVVTGFFLIPTFGLDVIIVSVGALLVVMGAIGLAATRLARRALTAVALLATIGLGLAYAILTRPTKPTTLYHRDGRYERITVYDTRYRQRPVRILQQDRNTESGIYLNSDELPFDYTRYYRLLYALTPRLDRVAAIGGGAYTIPKRLVQENEHTRVDVAEIEPALFPLAKQYFGVPDTPRLTNTVIDGRRFLAGREGMYDAIFGDAYHSLLSIPSHLTTREFFQTVRASLRPDGVFMLNVVGSIADETPSFTLSEIKTLKAVFPNSYFFAVDSLATDELQNLIFVGVNGDQNFDFKQLAAANPEVVYQDAARNQIDISRYDLGRHRTLTDNYAPVDHYAATMFRRHLRHY